MADGLGTRTKALRHTGHEEGRGDTRSHTRDLGMTKRVSSNLTFSAGTGRITGSNGDFAAFAIDGTNQAYIVVDPAPKDEGPVAALLRTP